MAQRFVGVNRGQYYNEVVSGASTNSTEFEFAYTTGLPREQVLTGLEKIRLWLLNDSNDAVGEGHSLTDTNF